ncbi:hypothetical protein JXA47_09830 [Candidatus Sumerlaeota bacterium]|nr:hypothetical protein [Candidatus Sumerlaeota bacterium]
MTLRVLSLALALFAVHAAGQLPDLTLSTPDLEAMPPDARAKYEEAISAFDHANHGEGFRLLRQASEIAPDVVNLQFLVAGIALDRAESSHGSDALDMIEWAREAHMRVIENPEAPTWQVSRAQRGLETLAAATRDLGTREIRLREAGDAFIRQHTELEARIAANRVRRVRQLRREAAEPAVEEGTSNPLLLPSDESRRLHTIPESEANQGTLPTIDSHR